MPSEIRLDAIDNDTAIQRKFTPELLAEIDAAHEDLKEGNGRTLEHLNERLAATKAEWLRTNQI